MTTITTPSRRRARRTAAGVALGAVLVVGAPLAASAHIHVTSDAPAGASTRLDFTFSHGCEGAATTALVFTVPEGVDGVTPVFDAGWTVARELGDDGIPTTVTYTAATPVEDGLSASVSMDVIFASSTAGTDVAFPVRQECATGVNDWSQVAEEGADPHDLDAPAPVVAVGEAVADDDGHGTGSSDDAASDATGAEADPVARWLAGGALAAALAALAVTLVRRRRS